jgi:hypothetical protein
MTSAGLSELKKMINEAATKRIELIATVRREERSLRWAQWRVRLARWFLIRLFSESIVLKLATQLTDAENSVNTARERLSECSIPIDFDFDQPTLDAYSALVRSFEGLITCQRAWNVTLSLPTNRFVERTRARESIDRQLVDLNFQQSDIIDTSQKAIHFTNANGNDIYFYPGFLMIPDRDENFALLNIQELHLSFSKSPYYEDAGVPSDSEIVGHAWKKENKDGSRDRRFADNSQIPIAKYASIEFRSSTGLREAYQFSSYSKPLTFFQSLSEYQKAVARLSERSKTETLVEPSAGMEALDKEGDTKQTCKDGHSIVPLIPPSSLTSQPNPNVLALASEARELLNRTLGAPARQRLRLASPAAYHRRFHCCDAHSTSAMGRQRRLCDVRIMSDVLVTPDIR